MEQIKFRLYRLNHSTGVVTFSTILPFASPAHPDNRESNELMDKDEEIISLPMQFTCRTDGQGVEMFEGDRCVCTLNGFDAHVEEVETEVYYDVTVGAFGHKVISPNSNYKFFGLNSKDLLSCKIIGNIYDSPYLIIGNIYQNPELLK